MNKEIYGAVREITRKWHFQHYEEKIERGIEQAMYDDIAKTIAEAVPEKITKLGERRYGWNAFHDTLLKNLRRNK